MKDLEDSVETQYKVALMSPDVLEPFEQNPYLHSDRQIELLKKSMKEFGFTVPIIVNQDNMVLAGHARLRAAKELNLAKVPVIVVDFNYQKSVSYVVTDNQQNTLSTIDNDLMKGVAKIIADYAEISGFDVEATGYSVEDFDKLLEDSIPEFAPEIPDEFQEYDGNIETDHKCPKCGYEWSGAAK